MLRPSGAAALRCCIRINRLPLLTAQVSVCFQLGAKTFGPKSGSARSGGPVSSLLFQAEVSDPLAM